LEGEPDNPSILFVNAQNKQTMRDIVGPLREFGVPAAAIADIDLVKDGGSDWTTWLSATQFPSASHLGLGQNRSTIKAAFEATGKNMKTDGGITLLAGPDRAAAELLFDQLDQFGLFTVRHGEVESWLMHLGVPGKKTDWTIGMLERMGSDPTDANYVKPDSGDVWNFMRSIVSWVKNPARRGTA